MHFYVEHNHGHHVHACHTTRSGNSTRKSKLLALLGANLFVGSYHTHGSIWSQKGCRRRTNRVTAKCHGWFMLPLPFLYLWLALPWWHAMGLKYKFVPLFFFARSFPFMALHCVISKLYWVTMALCCANNYHGNYERVNHCVLGMPANQLHFPRRVRRHWASPRPPVEALSGAWSLRWKPATGWLSYYDHDCLSAPLWLELIRPAIVQLEEKCICRARGRLHETITVR